MASELYLYPLYKNIPKYFRKENMNIQELNSKFVNSKTVYVGNLSFFTSELQILSLFSQCGEIENIILGKNKQTDEFCGFCFVIYRKSKDAWIALRSLNGRVLDDRSIKVEIDSGFKEGRQYGRGASGSQVRDEKRKLTDEKRPVPLELIRQKRKRSDAKESKD